MPIVKASPFGPKPQMMLASGAPASGYKVFFYVAGSNVKQSTFTDSTGTVANTNPIVLNSMGQPTTQIWFQAGAAYRVVFASAVDSDPPSTPLWNIDGLTGINDSAAIVDQWVAGPAPTYTAPTSFSLLSDQTSAFTPGRRVRLTVTAGTCYGTIVTSSFDSHVTSVVLAMDGNSVMDLGLSAVFYSLLTADNPGVPAVAVQTLVSGATVNLAAAQGRTLHISGSAAIASFGPAPHGLEREVVFDGTPVLTYDATALTLPGGANITAAVGDAGVWVSEGGGNWRCVSYQRSSGVPVKSFPSGTRMIFQQTSAPVGWTKETSAAYNDAALRIVTGTAGTGGAVAFATAFASGLASSSYTLTTADIPSHTHSGTTGGASAGHTHTGSGSTGGQSADHTHGAGWGTSGSPVVGTGAVALAISDYYSTTGASSDHSHAYSFTTSGNSADHAHSFTSNATGSGGGHSHALPSFAVKYVDSIIAAKD